MLMSFSRAPEADQGRWGRTSRIHDVNFSKIFKSQVMFIMLYEITDCHT